MTRVPARELLVGLDVGTTMTKAAVVGLDGRELAHGSSPTAWRKVSTGAEVPPEQFFDGAMEAVAAAIAAVPEGRVVGMGVTSMGETVVLLGPDGRPATNSIAWPDTRGEQEASELVDALGWGAFVEHTGLSPSPMCTLVKLRWLHRREVLARCARAMCVANWLVHRLGGEQVVDASLASRTGALSLAARSWWGEALEWAGAPLDLFPPVVQAGDAAGTASGDVPEWLRGAALAPPATRSLLRGSGSSRHDCGAGA
jgi:xylulokinase